MLELNSNFQEELFTKFIRKFGIRKCILLSNKSQGMIYHYRNNRIKLIPKELIKRVCSLCNIIGNQLKDNIIKEISFSKSVKEILDNGRQVRKDKLKQYKKDIPKLNEIVDKNSLNLEKWFNKHIKLINFGARQFKEIKRDKEKIKLVYTCYSNSKKKEFTNYLPRKIKLNRDFLYFFGLWCGDRIGKGRFGVANKEKAINLETKEYLIKVFQKPELILHINKGLKIPKLDYINSTYVNKAKTKIKGWCAHVYSKNAIFFRFFDYLLDNIDLLLSKINKKEIFFAGLFDAEGNVSLEDSYFRWACQNKRLVKIYQKYLKELKLFDRYDKCCLITKNKEGFLEKIYPYIKHPSKVNRINLICSKKGFVEERSLNILKIIQGKPGMTQKEIAKHLKRVKVYAHLMFLENLNYIKRKNYPKMNYITNKGVDAIHRGQGQR